MSRELQPEFWEVKRGNLITKSHGKISMTCSHRQDGACGGCYARLYLAFQLIKVAPEAADIIIAEVLTAMEAENAVSRLTGKGES